MRKLLLALAVSFSFLNFAKYNVYVGGGFNFLNDNGHLNQIKSNNSVKKFVDVANKKDKKHFDVKNFNVKLEITKNVTENFEIGVGAKYVNNAPHIYSVTKKDYTENSTDSDVRKIQQFEKFRFAIYSTVYNSVPIYLTMKYNFDTNIEGLRPYVKADLGYSFNVGVKKPKFEYTVESKKMARSARNNSDADIKSSFDKIKKEFDASTVSSTNGVYVGTALGVEYKNVFFEVESSYVSGNITINNLNSLNGNGNRDRNIQVAQKPLHINNGDFKISANVGFKI